MKGLTWLFFCVAFIALLAATTLAQTPSPAGTVGLSREDYLSWTAQRAMDVGKAGRANGRIGGAFDLRVVHTEHAYNYKLRATLMTPELIQAAARLEQLRGNLSDEQTRALVADAEAAGPFVVMVELDAREGSGVIPLDWRASLQPKGAKSDDSQSISGTQKPALRHVKALNGVARRDYAYDIFWVVFPAANNQGEPLITPTVHALELIVGIHNKAGRVSWPVSEALRQRFSAATAKQQ